MLIRWSDLDDAFSRLEQFRREMSRWEDDDSTFISNGAVTKSTEWSRGWPRMKFIGSGTNLVLTAEVPGLSHEDVTVAVNQDVLTVSGERKAEVPEGYRVHRHERAAIKFSRSFALPCKVDLERSTAMAKNGILTITLPKAPESQPRQITVKSI